MGKKNMVTMFEYLKDFRNILVVGPHRSGTTILANMIVKDTDKIFYDESTINNKYVRKIPGLFNSNNNIVLQAPYATSWTPVITGSDIAIVICKRNMEEIKDSVKNSKTKRGKGISQPPFSPDQIYSLWSKIKYLLDNPFEVNYDDLQQHPMWVDKSKRGRNWHHKQLDYSGSKY